MKLAIALANFTRLFEAADIRGGALTDDRTPERSSILKRPFAIFPLCRGMLDRRLAFHVDLVTGLGVNMTAVAIVVLPWPDLELPLFPLPPRCRCCHRFRHRHRHRFRRRHHRRHRRHRCRLVRWRRRFRSRPWRQSRRSDGRQRGCRSECQPATTGRHRSMHPDLRRLSWRATVDVAVAQHRRKK